MSAPVDAAPSPDGSRIYYLAVALTADDEPSPGVFAVDTAAAGSGEIQRLALGAPLLTPLGIESSLDGKTLYIADTAAGDAGTGAVYSLPVAGGSPALVQGTEGYRPAGVVVGEMRELRGEETLYFTGREPDSGRGAVFRVASAGGEPTRIALFDTDSEPGGVALAANGDLYVADHAGGLSRVLRVHDGAVSTLVAGVALGFPAGVALTKNDHTLLVSGLDAETKHDVVYAVSTANAEVERVTMEIGAFSEAAGLHRAHGTDVFAWADSQAEGPGSVYSVKF